MEDLSPRNLSSNLGFATHCLQGALSLKLGTLEELRAYYFLEMTMSKRSTFKSQLCHLLAM